MSSLDCSLAVDSFLSKLVDGETKMKMYTSFITLIDSVSYPHRNKGIQNWLICNVFLNILMTVLEERTNKGFVQPLFIACKGAGSL